MQPSPTEASHARVAGSEASPAPLRLALAGGGTGGHIVPGLHLLAHLAQLRERGRTEGAALGDLVWFLAGRPVERRVLAGLERLSEEVERVPLALERETGGAPSRGELAWRTAPAVLRARKALVAHRSEVLLGLGGYASFPAVLAARSLGIPVALLEVNAEPGAATRWLARFATRVLHAWPASLPRAGEARRHAWVGPPLAPAYTRGAPSEREARAARIELGFDPERPLLVVLGGSQGAGALNAFVRTHATLLVASRLSVLHQCGPGRLAESGAGLEGLRTLEYLERVELALAGATLVLCRGGASTLAEVAALRRPAVVVPYPHHADRHQERNAGCLGAGVRVVAEQRLSVELARELVRLARADGRAEREAMARALERAVPGDGTARLWSELVGLRAHGASRSRAYGASDGEAQRASTAQRASGSTPLEPS